MSCWRSLAVFNILVVSCGTTVLGEVSPNATQQNGSISPEGALSPEEKEIKRSGGYLERGSYLDYATDAMGVAKDSNGNPILVDVPYETKSRIVNGRLVCDYHDAAGRKVIGGECPNQKNSSRAIADPSATCSTAFSKVEEACRTSGWADKVQMAALVGTGLSGALPDARAACKARKALSTVYGVGTAGKLGTCGLALTECRKPVINGGCGPDPNATTPPSENDSNYKNYKRCGEWGEQIGVAGASQLAVAGGNYATAQNCDDLLDPNQGLNCKAKDSSNNPYCYDQYCASAAHKNEAFCQAANKGQCSDPATAQNNPACGAIYCLYNPDKCQSGQPIPGLARTTLTPPTLDTGGIDDGSGLNLGSGDGTPPFTGFTPSQGKPTPYETEKGGAMGSTNAGAYPGGKDGGGGGGGGGTGRDLTDKGFGGNGGGFGVANVPTGGGAGGYGGPGNGQGEKIDLSKFLPGGQLDPKSRMPASEQLKAEGITEANGLSNFEKVTRMMNRKRPYLKLAE